MPACDRGTVGGLLADSHAVSRESLLEVRTSQGPATGSIWGQVVHSAARLWAVPLPISLATCEPVQLKPVKKPTSRDQNDTGAAETGSERGVSTWAVRVRSPARVDRAV